MRRPRPARHPRMTSQTLATPRPTETAEARRLASLKRLEILDTAPERDFDDLVVIASQLFDVPIALVSLIDSDRQWFKARVGLSEQETHRNLAFCAHAIMKPEEVFTIEDATLDPRFANNPLVTGDPHIRFYAGAPIISKDGEALGTLCVIDRKTGSLDATQRQCLEALARQASLLIELRRQALAASRNEAMLIEEARERQAALESVEAALRQSQKMEALGQLTGGLAHDFNNLLTGITGSLELLQLRVSEGRIRELDRYLIAAQTAAKRAAALTHRLLAFARRQTLAPKATDINRLIADMEEMIRRTVGPQIVLEVACDSQWSAMVDANQLENALLNLCINARDAMPEGGRLTITTANHALDDLTAQQYDLACGHYLTLSVTDTGSGMNDEVVKRAFDPFFTTKPLGAGTGLGLSMVYGFARQSGGQVAIASEVGRGTTMSLYLPRHAGPAVEVGEGLWAPIATGIGHEETVLIIDDEPTVRMLIAEVLEDLGYRSLEAHDGAAGLKLLQSDTRIDLLITDVGLPGGLNGRQVADAARALRAELKVLFITGYAETTVIGGALLEDGMQVLTKPFSLDELSKRIGEMLRRGAS
jgi:signal transduction histidine kinase